MNGKQNLQKLQLQDTKTLKCNVVGMDLGAMTSVPTIV